MIILYRGKELPLLFLVLVLLISIGVNLFVFQESVNHLIYLSFLAGLLLSVIFRNICLHCSDKHQAWYPTILFLAPYFAGLIINLLILIVKAGSGLIAVVCTIGVFLQVCCFIATYKHMRKLNTDSSLHRAEELMFISGLNIVTLFFLLLVRAGYPIHFGFEQSFFFCSNNLIMLFAVFRLYWFWYHDDSLVSKESHNDGFLSPYRSSGLCHDQMEQIAERLLILIEENQIYLDADLDLKKISVKSGIPKHHISQVLNIYIGKSFYRLLAECRIKHAKEIFKNNKNIKIESLAYSCGFNSVSSFYKYFKEVSGTTPAEYIMKIEDAHQQEESNNVSM